MSVQSASDGSDVPGEPLQCAPGPRSRWVIGSYAFERWARTQEGPGSRGRWGCCCRNSRGVSNCRTPLAAFLSLRRWMRQPDAPPGE
jgi:hypothetical protein